MAAAIVSPNRENGFRELIQRRHRRPYIIASSMSKANVVVVLKFATAVVKTFQQQHRARRITRLA